jgi:acyl carrier protein
MSGIILTHHPSEDRSPDARLVQSDVGVEVFRLPKDFDTGQHTVVRVTANEVRKKLAQQYLAENGAYRPIKIDLPPGSYVNPPHGASNHDVDQIIDELVERRDNLPPGIGDQHVDRPEPFDGLMDAGLDSLDVMELAFDIEDRFKIQLPQIGAELISFTYGDLCRLVEKQLASQADSALAVPSASLPA